MIAGAAGLISRVEGINVLNGDATWDVELALTDGTSTVVASTSDWAVIEEVLERLVDLFGLKPGLSTDALKHAPASVRAIEVAKRLEEIVGASHSGQPPSRDQVVERIAALAFTLRGEL